MISKLATMLMQQSQKVDSWINNKIKGELLYVSFDLRHSGTKITSIDSNLFPAGFNNLDKEHCIQASAQLANRYSGKKIMLVVESYTRNEHYIQNIVALKDIIENANNEVVCVVTDSAEFTTDKLNLEQIHKSGNMVATRSGFVPDIVMLNKDMTEGIPDILSNITQEIIPHLRAGWFNRKKSDYFHIYNKIAGEFATYFNFDPWLIFTMFSYSNNVDFKSGIGMDDIANKVEYLLKSLQLKYDEYSINEAPYLFLKANNGTHGMGLGIINNPEDVYSMNKNLRKKMHMLKNSIVVKDVVIQEGIKTIDMVNNAPAEPMIYAINNTPIGWFYRYNTNRSIYNSLNSQGMCFTTLNSSKSDYMYIVNVIAKLSIIATEYEYIALNS